jgi:hypothetical protein
MSNLWQYIAALMLLAHGLGHLTGMLAGWTSVNSGFADKPWVLPGSYSIRSTVGAAWGVIWLAAMILFIGSGIGVLMEERWWRTLAIVGSFTSIVAMAPWWNTIHLGARMGVVLDVAIIAVLLLPWGDNFTDFFEVP